MAGSYHTRVGTLQHSPRKMVCQHCRFPGHQRLQAMATPWHIQERWWEEKSWKCVQDLRWYLRSLDIPLEQHQWDVQWHQTGQTRNYQLDQHIKILVTRCGYTTENEKKQWQLELLFQDTKHFKVKEVGQITDSTERNSYLWQTTTTCQTAWGNC